MTLSPVGCLPQAPKASNSASQQQHSTTTSISASLAFGEHNRRIGHSSGARKYCPTTSPRNNQPLRKQHKMHRTRLRDDDSGAENTAIRSTTGRKGQTSITHLLDFSPPSRPLVQSPLYQTRSSSRRHTWLHPVDKARYIHANYRFIMDPKSTYSLEDVDGHLEWHNVLQVLASAVSQSAACPICLSVPVAPRMAQCGHLFCLPCLMHYIQCPDDRVSPPYRKGRWKPCPICSDTVYLADVKPLRWLTGQEKPQPKRGDDVFLRLMARRPNEVLALPRDYQSGLVDCIPWFSADIFDYARVMKGSDEYMDQQYDTEIEQLRVREAEDKVMFNEESLWTQKAIAAIQELKVKSMSPENLKPDRSMASLYISHGSSAQSLSSETTTQTPLSSTSKRAVYRQIQRASSVNSPNKTTMDTSRRHVNRELSDAFFFYQALPNLYLAPLDIRILKEAFGEYSAFPPTLLPVVEKISPNHVVDDNLRRRAKYLAHLPKGCEVSFLECDWTDVVPREILSKFSRDTERRRRRNQEKETLEEKEKERAESVSEHEALLSFLHQRPPYLDRKPSTCRRGSLANGDQNWNDPYSTSIASESAFPPTISQSPTSALRETQSQDAIKTVWGTTIPLADPHTPETTVTNVGNVEEDGWLKGWEQDILKDIDSVSPPSSGFNTEVGPTSMLSSGTVRKKKNKRITLMSTNGRRAA